jgi:monoamine oxidase
MESKTTKEVEIIIIGGGLAGLAAAKVLEDQGVSYLLLEGSERLGGRIHSVQWEGDTLELGA